MKDGDRVSLVRRTRPLRIGYLVDPRSAVDVRLAIETATAHWGGVLHPLIPMFERRPPWWRLRPFGSAGPRQIELAYREAFHCDFVVDARKDAAEEAPSISTITVEQLRRNTGEPGIEVGLPATAIYKQLWSEEFRWEARRRTDVIIPIADEPTLAMFVAACFGCFTSSGDLADLEESYRRAFDAERLPITPMSMLDGLPIVARNRYLTPIEVTRHGLRIGWRGPFVPIVILLLDASEPADLVDFWNLRASGQRVLPVPTCWADQALLEELAERLAGHPELRERWASASLVDVMGAHRVSKDAVDQAATALRELGLGCTSSRYPSPGREFGFAWCAEHEDDVEVTARNGRLELPLRAPAAAEHYPYGLYRWMTVLDYRASTLPDDGSVAALLPAQLNDITGLLDVRSHLELRASHEGWLLPSSTSDDRLDFRPATGRDVLAALLASAGKEPTSSEPGRVAEQLVRQLGGLRVVSLVQHQQLVKLFNRAANSAVAPEDDREQRRRPTVRFIPWNQLHTEINRAHPNNPRAQTNVMRALIAYDVIRSGLQLDCTNCDYANWVALGELGPNISCERCLATFPFPQDSPPSHHRWAYRPTGAFSVEDYAHGGYTVAFALAFLTGQMHARASWTAGLQLTQDVEVDFALVRQDDRDEDDDPVLLLGEAKSYGRFGPRDFERARILRALYPEATLVFATLRADLSKDEREQLVALARPNVTDWRHLPQDAQILILTAVEMYGRDGPPGCWQAAGGRACELSVHARRYPRPELRIWADLTLQLHLGLEPHHEWLTAELKRLDQTRV